MSHKKSVKNQNYENYWKLTLAYSNINGSKFRNTLQMIVDAFNKGNWDKNGASSSEYEKLTNNHQKIYKLVDPGSSRKALNQYIKLGFFKPGFKKMNSDTKSFLNANSNEERKKIYSDIVYNHSSFNSSYSHDDTNQRQINFVLKTLMFHPNKKLNVDELKAITMVGDLSMYKHGYMTKKDLEDQIGIMKLSEFEDRKYNQISYVINCLKKLEGLSFNKAEGIAYTEDNIIKVYDGLETKRDPYQWRLTRSRLIQESIEIYGDARCFYSYYKGKGLVASHIIPFAELIKQGKVDIAYDYKNTLLLKQEVDAYFDKHEISFDEKGNILYSSKIDINTINEITSYKHNHLDYSILDKKRIMFLNEHRRIFIEKNS